MLDIRPILFVIGLLLATLAVAMCFSAIADAASGHEDWRVFAASAALTMFVGVTLLLTNRSRFSRLTLREAFVLTAMSWLVLTLFAALPFAFADLGMSFTDAFFEAMSGITTTGSTVMVGLDEAPAGILLWRAILQWLGGIGIIVMAIGVLPILRVGGMQFFRMEFAERTEKVLPRAAQISLLITVIYLGGTALCALSLWLAGLSGFDAIAHAMTTIATGGYSTRDASVGAFQNPTVEIIITGFMVASALPFLLYLRALRGDPGALWRDPQVRAFLGVLAVLIGTLSAWQILERETATGEAVRLAAFNIVSVITGTGYASTDYGAWGGIANGMFLFIMFIGGCAGSTTCGIKIFRFQVMYATTKAQMKRLIVPHGVFMPVYEGRPISDDVAQSVMSFFFLFVAAFTLLALGLALLGLDFVTAVSGAATAICNVGPALGDIIGPAGNFQPLPDAAKWLLCAGMLLGRLELFTVLVLFAPSFWRG